MIYDDFAARLAKEYELFLFALSGQYLSLAAPGIEASPASISLLRTGGGALRATFLQNATRTVGDFVLAARMDVRDPSIETFMKELGEFSHQNIESLVDRMRGVKTSALDAMDNMHGAMGGLLQQKLATPEFQIRTASGRSFKALSLVKTQARHFAYQGYVRGELKRIASYSDLAKVVYPDPAHKGHGLVFSITGATPGYPSYAQIAERVFHYNSSARVTDHVPA